MEKFFKLIEKIKVLNIKKQLKKMLVLLLFSVKFYRNDINNTKEVVLSFLQLTIYLNIIFSVSWWLVSNGRYFLIVMGFFIYTYFSFFFTKFKKSCILFMYIVLSLLRTFCFSVFEKLLHADVFINYFGNWAIMSCSNGFVYHCLKG